MRRSRREGGDRNGRHRGAASLMSMVGGVGHRPGREPSGGGKSRCPAVEHAQEAPDPLQVLVVEHAQQVPDLAGVEVTEAVDQLGAGRRQAHEDPPAVRSGRATGDQSGVNESVNDPAHRRLRHTQAADQLGHAEVTGRQEVQHLGLGHRDVDVKELRGVRVGQPREEDLVVGEDVLDDAGSLLLVDAIPLRLVLTVRSDLTIRSGRYTGAGTRAAMAVGCYRPAMGLGFGLLSAQLRPGETGWTRAYDETVALAVEAERIGFTSVWTTEHHFVDDGYMPSLLVVGAALAQATSRIELGTGVILAPLHHPLRLAEDAATVQLLSHGRLVLGLGLGWSEVEFGGLGADARRRGAAMDEILQILPRAWTGEPFTHHGAVYDLPTLAVRPAPSTPIPILVGGSAEPAIRRAARLADGMFANAPVEQFVQQVRWVLDECERIGRDPATFRFIHYSVLLPGRSREEAIARYRDVLWAMQWKYSDMEASAIRSLPAVTPPPFDRPDDALVSGRATCGGTPDDLVEALLTIREQAGVPVDFVARSHFPLLEYDAQVDLMHELAEGVAHHV